MALSRISIAVVVALVAVLVSALGILFLSSGPEGEVLDYHNGAGGWSRESIVWDPQGQRFLLSDMKGGITQLPFNATQDELILQDQEVSKYASLGLHLDEQRHRLLVVYADLVTKSYSALASYDTRSWSRIFLTTLHGPDRSGLADDVTVDPAGTAYVTDGEANVIYRVDLTGKVLPEISSPVFTSQGNQLPFNLVGLNGIRYHPDGFLLVAHTWAGVIFKVAPDGSSVKPVRADKRPFWSDGLALASDQKLAVAGIAGVHLLESSDGWETASLTKRYRGPLYRYASAAAVKDGRVFVNFLVGLGWNKKTFSLREAVFLPV